MPKGTPHAQIAQSVRYLNKIKQAIDKMPVKLRGVATTAGAEFLMEKIAFYNPYQFYGRAQAYPEAATKNPEAWMYINSKGIPTMHPPIPGYFSLKQFRFVMSLKSKYDFGFPHRTGNMQRAWHLERKGAKTIIVNTTRAAKYTKGTKTQARQPAGAGWTTVQTDVEANTKGAIAAARKAVRAEIKKMIKKQR